MNCVSCAIYACTTLGLFVFFPWGIPQLQSDYCGACPVTTDLVDYNNNKHRLHNHFQPKIEHRFIIRMGNKL